MNLINIEKTARNILNSVPPEILVIAAAKTRTIKEVQAALEGGIKFLGYNYVQEAETIHKSIENEIEWYIQRNKVKTAVKLFDMIETIDSVRIAGEVDKISKLENVHSWSG